MEPSPVARQEKERLQRKKGSAAPPRQLRPRDEYVTSLRRGSSLLKFGRTGTPDFKFFRISADESELQWKSDLVGHGTRAVRLADVREIMRGQTTQTFKRDQRPQLERLSFSLIYEKRGRERTLDLVCKTEQEYELWLHGMQAFVSFQREKRSRLSQSVTAAEPMARTSISKLFGSQPVSAANPLARTSMPIFFPSQPVSGADPLARTSMTKLFGSQSGADPLAEASHSKFRGAEDPLADADDGEDAQEDDPSGGKSLLGDVYVWGGREADLTTPVDGWQQTMAPVLVNDSARLDVNQVAISSSHAVLVTKCGHMYSWGRGISGQLGHGGSQDFAHPKLVRELWDRSITVEQVDCSDGVSIAVTTEGKVLTWGDGKKSGVLGHGKMVDRHWTPHKIEFPMQSIRIVVVSAGPFHCGAVSSHGGLYTWGDGFGGRLGHGTHESRYVPTFVDYFNDMRVQSVACGVFHTAAVASPKWEGSSPNVQSEYTSAQELLDRPVMAAAAFAASELPEVPKDLSWGPLKTPARRSPAMSFMCSAPQTLTPTHSLNINSALDEQAWNQPQSAVPGPSSSEPSAAVFTWGANDRGCLGRGEEGQDELLPGQVGGELTGLDMKQVACGYHLTAALTSCGRAYQWGSTGTAYSEAAPWTRSDTPMQVRGEMDGWNVQEIQCGNHHCIATAKPHGGGAEPTSVLFAWGRGVEGQLGNEAVQDSGSPVKVKALKGQELTGIVAGGNHCMAVCRHNPAVTEAAAKKDAERLRPFLLGKDEKARKSNLTIQVPSGYTTGGPLSSGSNASNGSKAPEHVPRPVTNRRNSTALVLHSTATGQHKMQRRSIGSSSGTLSTLFRAGQATYMARKAAANAAKARKSEGALLLKGGLVGAGSTFNASGMHARDREDMGQCSDPGEAFSEDSCDGDSKDQSMAATDNAGHSKQYVQLLESQVAKLSSKIESLEEQLHRRVRREHEPVRSSFASLVRVRNSQESLAATGSSGSTGDALSGPGVELPIPAASTTTRSPTSQPLVPPTPNTEGTATNGFKTPGSDSCSREAIGINENPKEEQQAENSATADCVVPSPVNMPSTGLAVGEDEADSHAMAVAAPAGGLEGSGESSACQGSLSSEPLSSASAGAGANYQDPRVQKLMDENLLLREHVSELMAQVRELSGHIQGVLRPQGLRNGDVDALRTSDGSTPSQQTRRLSSTSSTGTPVTPGEWVETIQPGVHLTLGPGTNGQAEVRKVRFSSKSFSKGEAEAWWKENCHNITERYIIPAAAMSPFSGMGSGHGVDLSASGSHRHSLDVPGLSPTPPLGWGHNREAMSALPISPTLENPMQTPPGAAPPTGVGSPSTMAKPAVVLVD